MGLERDWDEFGSYDIRTSYTEKHRNVRKKTARKYNRSNKECQMCCSITEFKQNREPKRNTLKSVLFKTKSRLV